MCLLDHHSSILVLPSPLSSTPGTPVQVTFDIYLRIHSECHRPEVWQVLDAHGWNKKGTSVIDFSVVDQMCLSDEEPICGMCKLFGDHMSHQVAKISDAYTERKVSFAKDIQLVLQKSESVAQAMQVWLTRPMAFPHVNGRAMFGFNLNSFLFRTLG